MDWRIGARQRDGAREGLTEIGGKAQARSMRTNLNKVAQGGRAITYRTKNRRCN